MKCLVFYDGFIVLSAKVWTCFLDMTFQTLSEMWLLLRPQG